MFRTIAGITIGFVAVFIQTALIYAGAYLGTLAGGKPSQGFPTCFTIAFWAVRLYQYVDKKTIGKAALVFLSVLLASPLFAQETSTQARLMFHPQIDAENGWYATGWAIGNTRTKLSDNFNVLSGLGRWLDADGKSWIEVLGWQQFSSGRTDVLASVRLRVELGRGISMYAEASPYLSKKAFYDQAFLEAETKISPRLRVGLETENLHQAGKDKLGFGPRATLVLAKGKTINLTVSLSYQFRRSPEPNVIRAWVLLGFNNKPKAQTQSR